MKMGPKPKNKFKLTCLECGVPMNNDHRTMNETQSFVSCRNVKAAQGHQVGNPKCSKKSL